MTAVKATSLAFCFGCLFSSSSAEISLLKMLLSLLFYDFFDVNSETAKLFEAFFLLVGFSFGECRTEEKKLIMVVLFLANGEIV